MAWGLARPVATQFYGVPPTDLVTTIGVLVLLGTIAHLAAYIPARRATRIDPVLILRAE